MLCVVEQTADDELATVPSQTPLQGVQLPFRLFRFKRRQLALLSLVAVLAGDEDGGCSSVAPGSLGEAVLGDPGDGVSVDALGDHQAQRVGGRPRRTVEGGTSYRAPDRDALGARRDDQLVSVPTL